MKPTIKDCAEYFIPGAQAHNSRDNSLIEEYSLFPKLPDEKPMSLLEVKEELNPSYFE